MRRLITHPNILKGAVLGLLTFAIVASPFSTSPEKSGQVTSLVYAATYPDTVVQACDSNSSSLVTPGTFSTAITGQTGDVYTCSVTNNETQQIMQIYYDQNGQTTTLNNLSSQILGGNGVTQYDTNGKIVTPNTCYGEVGLFSSWTCIWHNLVASVASLIISITAWLLALSGALFNWLVYDTIVTFSSSIYDKVGPGVTNAWTAFRDIANILIIGIFTFIAISIILGLKEFGQKKMIARVLVIAVLINFSLLFTKMAIDASNFTALQIFNAAQFQGTPSASISGLSTCSGSGLDPTCGFAQTGIAGSFVGLMGVQGVSDTYQGLVKLADEQDSGWIAFVHGLLIGILFLGAAIVLLYGSFLLVSRVLLLIFLMVTASIAFASYLIPKWETSSYGWSTWWSSLVWSATLAPMLMLFLWMTLSVGNSMKTNSGTLGDLLTNPTKGGDLNALFVYVVVLGLLFVSFKLSSKWAGKAGGFNIASLAAFAPIGLGAQIGGMLLRQAPGLGGRGSARRVLGLDQEIDDKKDALKYAAAHERPQLQKDLYSLMVKKGRAEGRAGSSYNLMNTGIGKAVASGLGVSGILAGTDKKPASYMEGAKAQADKAAKEAAGLALSQEDKNKIRAETTQHLRERREDISLKKTQNQDLIKTIETGLKSETEPLEAEKTQHQSKKAAMQGDHATALKQIAEQMASSADEATRAGHQARYNALKAAQKGEMDEQDNKIKEIDQKLTDIRARTEIPELENKIFDIDKELKETGGDRLSEGLLRKATDAAVRKAEDVNRETAMHVGAQLAQGSLTNMIQRAVGINPENTVPARMAYKQTKKKIRIKGLADRRTAEVEAIRGAGENPDEGAPTEHAAEPEHH